MNTLTQSLYIGLGGFLGAVARYLVSKSTNGRFGAFPLGTLIVNVLGTFLLSFILYSVVLGKDMSPELRNFSTVGFIGAFTTMSTFSYETMHLFELGDSALFGLNLFLNIALCLSAAIIGKYLATVIFK